MFAPLIKALFIGLTPQLVGVVMAVAGDVARLVGAAY